MALTKKQEMEQLKKKNGKLLKMVAEEREKVAGYEQIAKVHSAYIAILLRKLGATQDNAIAITPAEVNEALEKYDTRAIAGNDEFSLYYEINTEE